MLKLMLLSLLSLCALASMAEQAIPLWAGKAPGQKGDKPEDIPTITPYLCGSTAVRPAMVIFPGGGYMGLADHEGAGYARFLVQHGVNCFVVKYRLGSAGYRHPIELGDAQRSMRWVRAHAAEFHVDPHKVGVMGSSAGGHLASTLLTHYDEGRPSASDNVENQSCRPDFGVLCYAVISMGKHTHQGSHDALLGQGSHPQLEELLSNEKQVTKDTPPCFLWHTWEDNVVDVENSLQFANALRSHGVRFDLHIYEKGGHGMGLGNNHPWSKDLIYWMEQHGWTSKVVLQD